MTYLYAYKTSDGTRHEDKLDAPSREAAFAALRQRGIRPIKVVAADGTKANGEVRGVRKRMVASIALVVALAAGGVAFWLGREQAPSDAIPSVQDRHQVYGDPATIQEIETGAIPIARTDVEKFLFGYAIPGRTVKAAAVPSAVMEKDLALTPIAASDRPEVVAYKQILNGLKEEARAYLSGGGTWRGYVTELNERQNRELEIYERTRRELEAIADPALRNERNAALRAMGLRTIPRPRK